MSNIVVQKIIKKYEKAIDRAIAYYSVLFTLSNMKLTKKEIELVAFIAVRGTITPLPARDEFISQFGSSKASMENIKGRLVKKKILIRQNKMYRVNPKIALDFDNPILLQIKLDSK